MGKKKNKKGGGDTSSASEPAPAPSKKQSKKAKRAQKEEEERLRRAEREAAMNPPNSDDEPEEEAAAAKPKLSKKQKRELAIKKKRDAKKRDMDRRSKGSGEGLRLARDEVSDEEDEKDDGNPHRSTHGGMYFPTPGEEEDGSGNEEEPPAAAAAAQVDPAPAPAATFVPLIELTVEELSAWLQSVKLSVFVDAFAEDEYDGSMIDDPDFGADDIDELGIGKKPQKRKLLKKIQAARSNGVPIELFPERAAAVAPPAPPASAPAPPASAPAPAVTPAPAEAEAEAEVMQAFVEAATDAGAADDWVMVDGADELDALAEAADAADAAAEDGAGAAATKESADGEGGDEDEDGEKRELTKEERKAARKARRAEKNKGKLSNKERRQLEKDNREAILAEELRQMELRDAGISAGVENFTVLQEGFEGEEANLAFDNQRDISIDGFSVSVAGTTLLENTSLKVRHGDRYGLLGANGAGKSTLLLLIAKRKVRLPACIDLLMVEQECVADDTPAITAVLRMDEKRESLIAEEKELMAKLDRDDADGDGGDDEDGVDVDALLDRLNEVSDELSMHQGAEANARGILAGLGFTAKMQDQACKHFSGGWRMRISLAAALFVRPTLLLLDEPTNHLDLNAVIWLDEYLQSWPNTLLVVSHDQDFLANVCNSTIHLEQKKLHYYRGNFWAFKKMHLQKKRADTMEYDKQQKRLRALKAKGTSKKEAEQKVIAEWELKGKSSSSGGGTDDGASSNQTRALLPRPKDYAVKFTFPNVDALRPPIIEVADMGFQYGPQHPKLFQNVNLGVDMDLRVSIVGPNGVGKSTFINLLLGELEPTEGSVVKNGRLKVGKYNQHFVDILPMQETPVQFLRRNHDELSYQGARNLLGKVGLGGHAHDIKCKNLSGGQKARVVFAELELKRPHILFFDEPTNHLDIESVDALCDGINNFNGGVIIISHDARLITETNCRMWVVEKLGCTPHEGGYYEYRDHILEQIELEEKKVMALAAQRQAERRAAAAESRTGKAAAARRAKLGLAPAKEGSASNMTVSESMRYAASKKSGKKYKATAAAAEPAFVAAEVDVDDLFADMAVKKKKKKKKKKSEDDGDDTKSKKKKKKKKKEKE